MKCHVFVISLALISSFAAGAKARDIQVLFYFYFGGISVDPKPGSGLMQ